MSSIQRSPAIMPCGPPKPRNAVFDTVLVNSGSEIHPHRRIPVGIVGSGTARGRSPARERSAE